MSDILEVFFRAVVSVLTIIALVRLVGLRSFSKMSSFDFALTVAMGSLLATTIMDLGTSVWIGLASLVAIFAVQFCISAIRVGTDVAEAAVDNKPLLLMERGEMKDDNLTAARVTRADVLAKLREANALDLSGVHAVVLETTGDISVLHGAGADGETLERLLSDVRRG